MDASLRNHIRHRAGDRCEYCRLPQHALDLRFHIEHIIARQHGGDDAEANLALACDRCNLHKGPNLSSIDPDSGQLVRLFHPRDDVWEEHFRCRGARVAGKTPTGRATVELLCMNAARRVELRKALLAAGEL